MPIPVIVLLSLFGLLVYASSAVAVAKSGKPYGRDDNTALIRISTVATSFIIWGAFIAYAAITTKTCNTSWSLESGLVDFGGFAPMTGILLLTLVPCDRNLRASLSAIWPVAYLARGIGLVGRSAGLSVAKIPNAIGTYIADSINEGKEVTA